MGDFCLDNLFLSDSIKDEIVKIANSNATLLITGESGVGKEFVAKTVHELSPQFEKKPVIINIRAIPEELLEKELFGSLAGAFTDAKLDSVGMFRLANNSTLILDDVGSIPLSIQGKLLNAIENGLIQPIGSSTAIKVNCRIIAISTVPIPTLVEKGLFRRDLYYRLNVLSLVLPPLRDRVSLIEKITNYYLASVSSPGKVFIIDNEAMRKLVWYYWPGNIRELLNTLERGTVMSDGVKITSDYLLLSSDNNVNISNATLKDAVRLFKKRYITQALENNGWNVTKSANFLDIQRTYLSRLIKELNIE